MNVAFVNHKLEILPSAMQSPSGCRGFDRCANELTATKTNMIHCDTVEHINDSMPSKVACGRRLLNVSDHDFDADLHDCQDRSPSPCLTIPRPGDSSWPQLHSCRSIGHNYVPKCCHK